VVIGDRALAEGNLEYKNRRAQDSQDVPQDDIVEFLLQQLS
jgi:prolyl-tRNA synthetase